MIADELLLNIGNVLERTKNQRNGKRRSEMLKEGK